MSLIKNTIYSMLDLSINEINPHIRLGTEIATLQLSIEYGELKMEDL